MITLLVTLSTVIPAQEPTPSKPGPTPLPTGHWRAWVESPGGSISFGLELQSSGSRTTGTFMNGPERIEIPRVAWTGTDLYLEVDYYDSLITAKLVDGKRLKGTWSKQRRKERIEMPFEAVHGPAPRFPRGQPSACEPELNLPTSEVSRWRVKFSSSEDPAVALFERRADDTLWGTFLTSTGDYRYLAGDADGCRLRLSVFDGAHAFLFVARVQPDGSMAGDFWSSNTWHETWTAHADPNARIPDAFAQTTWTGKTGLGELAFMDLNGKMKKLNDPAFAGKARIIEVFGTWCPNCRDATKLLVDLDRRYRDKGLSIVGLAFEHGQNLTRNLKQVRLYQTRFNIQYGLLVAGESDKTKASQAFPVLDRIRSYPTHIFLDASGEVRAIHTGFTGPATGQAYDDMCREFERIIEELLGDG